MSRQNTPALSVGRPSNQRRFDRLNQTWQFFASIPMTLVIAAATLALAFLPGVAHSMQFDLREGHWWSLLTSHLVHYNFEHLFWDLGVFIGVGAAVERKSTSLFLISLIVSALAIPAMSLLDQGAVSTYRGLSGVDTALFASFATHELARCCREAKRTEAIVFSGLLVAMIGKSLFEVFTGSTLFVSSSEFVPLPLAHLVGAAIGIVAAGVGHVRLSMPPR